MPDHAREDGVFRILAGAWSMMMDDLAGKSRATAMDDELLQILKEFVELDARNYDWPYCRRCKVLMPDPHRPDCLWWRARTILRERGVEIRDFE